MARCESRPGTLGPITLAPSKQMRPVREICTLGAIRRWLETDSRFGYGGTPNGNGEQQARPDVRNSAPVLDPTGNPAAIHMSEKRRGQVVV